jgi:hypothetical protein
MNARHELDLRRELDAILGDPIRGLRASTLSLVVQPEGLTVRVERPAALRRLLSTLVAAASWGGGVSWLRVVASWGPVGGQGRGGLRLAVGSRRSFQDAHARSGWTGIEEVLLAELRRAAEQAGGGEVVARSGNGELACEVRLAHVELGAPTTIDMDGAVGFATARRSA